MKRTVLLLFVFAAVAVKAQRDSTWKLRLSGIQGELSPAVYLHYPQQSQADYQKMTATDPFVNADLSAYTKAAWYYYATFSSLLGFKAYVSLKGKRKITREVFAGIKYGEDGNIGSYYTYLAYDTLAIYTENTGKKLYEVLENESYYNYRINSSKLIIPLGMNWCTDKSKLFWITMGVELSPVVNFGYVLTSTHGFNNTRLILQPGDSLSQQGHVRNNVLDTRSGVAENRTRLNGLGYGLHAGVPFTVYFHPFRRMVFLKHISALASVSPMYIYSYGKYTGHYSGFTATLAAGLRFNW